MANYHTVFDSRNDYPDPDQLFLQGESPKILQEIWSFIEARKTKIEQLFFTIPYFNNPFLDDAFKKWSKAGIKIHVICLPITCFNQKKIQWYVDLATGKEAFDVAKTAYQLARPIFGEHFKNPSEQYQLHCFAHQATHHPSVDLSFSLRNTNALAIYKSGGGAFLQSSSTLSVGQPVSENQLTIVEDDWDVLKSGLRFFNKLIGESVIIHHFDFSAALQNAPLQIDHLEQKIKCFFSAPFYKDAAFTLEEQISNWIKSAKKHLLIASPSLNSYEYLFDGTFHSDMENEPIDNFGLMRTVLECAGKGLKVRCISKDHQTPGKKFFDHFKSYSDTAFKTNNHLNFSFILKDEELLVATSNFHSNHFIFLDQVNLQNEESTLYKGTYSTINNYLIIKDPKISALFQKAFHVLWESGTTLS